MTNDERQLRASELIRHSGSLFRMLTNLCLAVFICGSLSCDRADKPSQLTLYTSIDEPIARPIIEQFEKQTGIDVVIIGDTEANKSVGLAERLRAERNRPRCDVWWGNEPFHTINLAREGLFQPYESPSAADVPAMYRDPQHRWAGNGLRARVIVWAEGKEPRGEFSLAERRFAIARPTAGTTAGYFAALYTIKGQEFGDEFVRRLGRPTLLGGNGPVAEAVGRGEFDVGWTDNDDAANVLRNGGRLSVGFAGSGTLMIPTTVALVANRPENGNARKLVDFLLSRGVENELIHAQFAGWSICGGEGQPAALQIDYEEVAKQMPEAVRRATAILEGREP